eukprot:Sdes_comp20373_c1_seq1m14216
MLLGASCVQDLFWKIVFHCTKLLPREKPIYLMGVGYAVDLVICSALGVDMFDCVYPTRTARFGTALVFSGTLHLKNKIFAQDFRPLEDGCPCETCTHFSRAYLHQIVGKEAVACHLLTIHNISFQLRLMKSIHTSIRHNQFPEFVRKFFLMNFPSGNYPSWVVDSLEAVNISLKCPEDEF